jgi:hypothetical protein
MKKLNELSNEKLGAYKKAAGADASKADKEGNFERGNKRFKGIVKATIKQGDNDEKKHKEKDEEITEEMIADRLRKEWLAAKGTKSADKSLSATRRSGTDALQAKRAAELKASDANTNMFPQKKVTKGWRE